MEIRLLSEETISRISAGEVIERPLNVVKELVENSIDAGASAIDIEIRDGGISMARVTDNGCGIAADQIARAFVRHATSKIRGAEDLSHLSSLGFRGEALASIAAVSQVEMITKTRDSVSGIRAVNDHLAAYSPDAPVHIETEEIGAPDGTTVIVRNLFGRIPVRKKFLRQPQTEAGYITDLVEKQALSHPLISFHYRVNGQEKLHTSGNGSLRELIYRIYGRETAGALLPVSAENPERGMRLEGFIGKPEISRSSRSFETFFINGRMLHSKELSAGLEEGYRTDLMQHRFPFAVLHLTLPPEEMDVNVHPSKMEVRFTDRTSGMQFLETAVHETLRGSELIPKAGLDTAREERARKKAEEKNRETRLQAEPRREAFETGRTSRGPQPPSVSGSGFSAFAPEQPSVSGSGFSSSAPQQPSVSGRKSGDGQERQPSGTAPQLPFDSGGESGDGQEKQPSGTAPQLPSGSGSTFEAARGEPPAGRDMQGQDLRKHTQPEDDDFVVEDLRTGISPGSGMPDQTRTVTGTPAREAAGASFGLSPQVPADAGQPAQEVTGSLSGQSRQALTDSGHLPQAPADAGQPGYNFPYADPGMAAEQLSLPLTGSAYTAGQESGAPEQDRLLTAEKAAQFRFIGQVFGTYWIIEYENRLLIIDQHAAHEKVNYERMMRRIMRAHPDLARTGTVREALPEEYLSLDRLFEQERNARAADPVPVITASQQLMPPLVLKLSGREETAYRQFQHVFAAMGYEIEDFGGGSYAIRAVPTELFGHTADLLLRDILEDIMNEHVAGPPQAVLSKVASMSCKAAVKGNTRLTETEARALIRELLTLDNPYHCPHGRPTMVVMSKYEMDRKFRRIV
ncbi:MAG: DNA mismatch repair endonuclease MutL [Eubacteriales bacterium]|nr:DNA mismatch repair endonuclease MutL [Eubacteriales bacterium]